MRSVKRWPTSCAGYVLITLGTDPVQVSLVTSLNHPGGNVTGISTMSLDLGSKWVELLHELLPAAKRFAVLANIANADSARSLITSTQKAALTIGLQLEFLFASDEGEIDGALAGLGARSQALIIQPEVLFLQNREKAGSTRDSREAAGALCASGISAGRRPDELWLELHRGASPGRCLCGAHPQRRDARRPARPARHKIRFCH
jgi:ABC transporter substrate binding protein